MKVQNPFKTHRILTVPGPKSKSACLMHVILCVVGLGVVSQNVRKHGGGMKLTPPSKKRDDDFLVILKAMINVIKSLKELVE